MEEKVMTFQELINYASEARDERHEFVKKQEEKRRKREEDIRSIIKKVIDNVKKHGEVWLKIDDGVLYAKCSNKEYYKKIKKIKRISLEDLKRTLDCIPALYADLDEEQIYVTFRNSDQ